MITTILFDLDGTLLPMDQEVFIKDYTARLTKKLMPYGYDGKGLMKGLWKSVEYMISNDGSHRNEELFWEVFTKELGPEIREREDLFLEFYENEFQETAKVCGFSEKAGETVRALKEAGCHLILATNPVFPPEATHSRVRWAGLDPSDFDYITTYDNSCGCKPNIHYYEEILQKTGCKPQECLMVGNDIEDDMVAEKLGMNVFLLTDCLINREGKDIAHYPQGGFEELMEWIQENSGQKGTEE